MKFFQNTVFQKMTFLAPLTPCYSKLWEMSPTWLKNKGWDIQEESSEFFPPKLELKQKAKYSCTESIYVDLLNFIPQITLKLQKIEGKKESMGNESKVSKHKLIAVNG